ncbi:hypothetical protein ABTY20_07895 [Streptomyces sp. NPDC126497]|uniref:hypothetical protein n=1 Tax=Streptomyces sp. NPDC126497 TaxID=3155313 RepID=UPI00331A2EA9
MHGGTAGMERMPYATDLPDEQWALIESLVTAWKQEQVARSTVFCCFTPWRQDGLD